MLRLRSLEEGESFAGGSPTSAQPLEGVDVRLRADDLEQARDHVDLDVELPELADQREQLLVRRLGERDDHALDIEQGD